MKRGKKVQIERKFMPGYVLAKLNMTDDIYHLVKNTPKVTGFLGNNNKPQAISEKEAARYFGGVEEAKSAPKKDISVDRNDTSSFMCSLQGRNSQILAFLFSR